MTEQEKIEQAAKKYVSSFERAVNKMIAQDSFSDGASFYAKEVMPELLAKAMEWISLKGLYQEIDGRWYDKFGGKVRVVAETTKDLLLLFEKYFEQSKQPQDAPH